MSEDGRADGVRTRSCRYRSLRITLRISSRIASASSSSVESACEKHSNRCSGILRTLRKSVQPYRQHDCEVEGLEKVETNRRSPPRAPC